jgi:cytochrome c-type biogenesis protein CcmH/NrfG
MRAIVPVRDRNESIDRYEACNRALDARQLAEAITACRAAVTAWRGNHLAWYALGNAFASREDWRVARDAYREAARLRPDAAMYQLYEGIASYQILLREYQLYEGIASYQILLRERQAHAAGSALRALAAALRAIDLDPAATRLVFRPYRLAAALSAAIDPATVSVARSRDALAAAASLAPDLWLAHYYLGLTERAQDHARLAAAAFTRSIQADPSQAAPYIALIELYRAWDFTSQSVVVAREASSHARHGTLATLAYELGMSYVATHDEARALAAFSKATSSPGGLPQATFQRGQTYLRIGDVAHAATDLEAFLALTDPSLAFEQQIARSQLTEIARKQKTTADYLQVPHLINRN